VLGLAAPSAAVPLELTNGGGVIVPVFLVGRGPHRFLLDTGAEGSTLSGGLARALAIEPVARVRVLTPAGEETRAVVRLDGLAVADAAAGGILASVTADGRIRLDGTEVDGVLGQDFLARFDFTLDYRRRVLVWGSGAPIRADVRLELRRTGRLSLVELPQGGSQRSLRFVPDSGADVLVVFDRAEGLPMAMERLPERASVESLSGQGRDGEMRRVRSLRIGAVTLRDQVAALGPHPSGGSGSDGLLPLHRFASVTFGNRDGFMVIRP
jgi:hypothetical protein